ncbi:hypothetical protein JCM10213v2_004646 [Rhodosporidiobolus nylandii]
MSAKSRLNLWSSLERNSSSLSSLLLPLLSATLAVCALLVQSVDSSSEHGLRTLVAENRKSLYTASAALLLALRPYSFGLLAPRIEVLRAEERRILLERDPTARAMGMAKGQWRGLSPAGSEAEGEDSDEEDNGAANCDGEKTALLNGRKPKVDTDALIRELAALQLAAVLFPAASFALALLGLACA